MSLKNSFGKSGLWMSAAAGANSLLSFVIFIILSRLLAPEEIGLVAFALIVVELGRVFVNAGLSHAIVRHTEWDQDYATTCFYLNVVLALVFIAAIFLAIAPLIAHYYDARAALLLQVLSIIFLLEGAKSVHEGKLKREFNFRAIALRSIIASLLSGIIGVLLAFNGYGVWALVWQQLINQVLITVITWKTAHWLPSLNFSMVHTRSLFSFSTHLTLSQIISNLADKAYEMLIAILLGPAALGFFRVGGRVLFILQEIIIKPFEQALLPALARLDERDARAQATLRVMRMSAYFIFPITFGAAAIGPEFIEFAFTEKWIQSGYVMTLLALGIAPLAMSAQINAALTANGHARAVMTIASIVFIMNCLLGLLFVPYGIAVAAAGFSLRSYLSIYFNLVFFKRVFQVSILRQLGTVAPAFSAALLMLGLVQAAKLLLPQDWALGLRLVLLASFGGAVYIFIMSCVFRAETKQFLHEGAAMAPAKAIPAIHYLQRLLRLT